MFRFVSARLVDARERETQHAERDPARGECKKVAERCVASDVPATAQSYASSASREKNRPGAPNRLKTSCGPRMQLTRSKRLPFLQQRLSYTQAVSMPKKRIRSPASGNCNNRAWFASVSSFVSLSLTQRDLREIDILKHVYRGSCWNLIMIKTGV